MQQAAGDMTDARPAWRRVLAAAGAYIALIIGSGFATGQEAVQFFAVHGSLALPSVVLCAVCLGYSCHAVLRASRAAGLETNEDVFRYFCGKVAGVAITWYTIVFFTAVFCVLVAGAAAVLNQAWDVPEFVGAGLMALMCVATLLMGHEKMVGVMSLLGPLIVALVIVAAVASLVVNEPVVADWGLTDTSAFLSAADNWAFAGVLYAGLILPGLAGVVPLFKDLLHSQREATAAATLGAGLFLVTMALVVSALAMQLPALVGDEVPLMTLADKAWPVFGVGFAALVFAGVYSTAAPILCMVCIRLAPEHSPKYRALVVGAGLLALTSGTLLPFGQLLNWIYPTVGYVGLFVFACVVFKDLSQFWGRGKVPG